jgi:hypothetical protein
MSEKRRVLVQKLMREPDLIILVENAIIPQIRPKPAMCIGTGRTIHCLYSKFYSSRRSVYNEPPFVYWMLPIVIAITTGATSRTVDWKQQNVWKFFKTFVDYRV